MKVLLSLLISLSPTYVLGQDSLPKLLKDFEAAQKEGLIRNQINKCSTGDIQKCAEALCGTPASVLEKLKKSDNADEYDPKRFGSIEDVKKKLSKILSKQQQKNKALFASIEKDLKKNESDEVFASWDDSEWQSQSRKIMLPHLKITYDIKKNTLEVTPNPPVDSDEKFTKALENYAVEAKNYFLRYPNDMALKDVLTESAKEKLYNASGTSNLDLCSGSECRKALVNSLNRSYINKLKFMKKENERKENLESKLITCLSNHIHSAQLQLKAENFRSRIPKVREEVLKTALDSFSESTRKSFKKYLEEDVVFDFGEQDPLRALKDSRKTALELKKRTFIVN